MLQTGNFHARLPFLANSVGGMKQFKNPPIDISMMEKLLIARNSLHGLLSDVGLVIEKNIHFI